MKRILTFGFAIFIVSASTFCNANQSETQNTDPQVASTGSANDLKEAREPLEEPQITFIELGSVNCVPCRMMQPVMKNIERKYGDQIKVVFYDVWTPEQRKYAQIYGIRVIPTQIFLNAHGEEILRHEGFFPEEEMDKFLQENGLSVLE